MKNTRNEFDVLFAGDFALFSNPFSAMSGSKYSYSAPTKSALRGMLEAIYWKPSVKWEVESVEILNRIQRESKNVLLQANRYESRQLGTNSYLKDVAYRVKARLVPQRAVQFGQDHMMAKHASIAHDRFHKGSGYAVPCLGTSECRAWTMESLQDRATADSGYYKERELHLDMMLLDIVYPEGPEDPLYRVFWLPSVENGIITFPDTGKVIEDYEAARQTDGIVVEKLSPGEYSCDFPDWATAEGPVIGRV